MYWIYEISNPTTGQLVQFAAERLWLEDRLMSEYNYPWIAWAGGMNNGLPNPDQLVGYIPPLPGPQCWELLATSWGWEPRSLPTDAPCLSAISVVTILNGLTAGASALSIIAGTTPMPISAFDSGSIKFVSSATSIATASSTMVTVDITGLRSGRMIDRRR